MNKNQYTKLSISQSKENTAVKLSNEIVKFMRKSIYNTLVDMLEQKESNAIFPLFCTVLTWIQILMIPFSDYLHVIWKTEYATKYLNYAYKYIQITPAIAQAGFVVFFVFQLVLCLMLIFQLANMMLITKLKIHKNINSALLISLQKIIVRMLMTFLCMPTFDFFVAVLSCSTSTGKIGSESMTGIGTCYGGLHLSALFVAICGLVLHSVLTGLANLWYFETNFYSNDVLARTPSVCSLWVFAYQLVLVLMKNLVTDTNLDYLVLIVLLVFSLYTSYLFMFKNPYLAYPVYITSRIACMVNLWGTCMLLLAKLFEQRVFDGVFFVWILGIPFIVLIVLTVEEDKLHLLALSINKIQHPEVVISQTQFLLTLCAKVKTNRVSKIIIEGFKENHYVTCDCVDCPLVKKENEVVNNVEPVLKYVEYIFKTAVIKFNKNALLRLDYVYFLKRSVQKQAEALNQLEMLESELKLTSELDFLVYRTKKQLQTIKNTNNRMQDELMEVNKNHLNEVPFQCLCKKFIRLMEFSCNLHIELWSHLLEEVPDLNIIKSIGTTITEYHDKINKTWQQINLLPSTNKLKYIVYYGKFLSHILNNRIVGNRLIQKSKEISNMIASRKNDISLLSAEQDLSELFLPTIAISGSPQNVGEIIKINTSAAMLFKYQVVELLGKNISMLIPNMYSAHHNGYVANAAKVRSLKFFSKDRLTYGKCKSGYLLPFNISVKPFFGEKPIFYAQIRPIKQLSSAGSILTDHQGNIETISTGIIRMFGISLKSVAANSKLSHYFDSLFEERDTLMDRGGNYLDHYQLNCIEDKSTIKNKRIYVEPHVFQHSNMENEYYIFQFNIEQNIDIQKEAGDRRNPKLNNEFQFKISPETKLVIGKRVSFSLKANPNLSSKTYTEISKINYSDDKSGAGDLEFDDSITVYRLREGKIVEIDHITEENEGLQNKDDKTLRGDIQKRKDSENRENERILQLMTDANDLKQILLRKSMPKFAKFEAVFANVLALLILAGIVTSHLMQTDFCRTLPKYQAFGTKYNLLINELLNAAQASHRMIALNNFKNSADSETELRQFLQSSASNIESLAASLSQSANDLGDPQINEILFSPDKELMTLNSGMVEQNTLGLIKLIITNSLILSKTPLNAFEYQSDSMTFVLIHNIILDAFTQLVKANDLISQNIEKCFTGYIVDICFQLAQTLLLLFVCAASYLYSQKCLDQINKNLLLFLDISSFNVRKYISKCENFIFSLKNEAAEELDTDDIDSEDSEEFRSIIVYRKRRRSKAIKISKSKLFYIKFATGILALEIIFAVGLIFNINTTNTIKLSNRELEVFSQLPAKYHAFLNIQTSLLFSQIEGIQDIKNVLVNMANIEILNQFNIDFDKIISENSSSSNSEFTRKINQIKSASLCDSIVEKELIYKAFYEPLISDCQKLLNDDETGSFVNRGLSIGLSKFEKNVFAIYQQFDLMQVNSDDAQLKLQNRVQPCSNTANRYCLFASDLYNQMVAFQNYYLTYFSKQLIGLFESNMESEFLSPALTVYRCILGFTVSLLVLVWLYVFLDNFFSHFNMFKRSEKLALLIPFENLGNSPDIKEFYEKLLELSHRQISKFAKEDLMN